MQIHTQAQLPTTRGTFTMMAFGESPTELPHVALVHEALQPHAPVYVRIHSECMTGDVFGSARCDCGAQLHQAMELCEAHKGILIYLRQEGRGIGLINKLHAYNLQDAGHDTLSANVALGFAPDARDYQAAIWLLQHLGVSSVRLLTNNPLKVEALRAGGIQVVERIPLYIPPNDINQPYYQTKRDAMGHFL